MEFGSASTRGSCQATASDLLPLFFSPFASISSHDPHHQPSLPLSSPTPCVSRRYVCSVAGLSFQNLTSTAHAMSRARTVGIEPKVNDVQASGDSKSQYEVFKLSGLLKTISPVGQHAAWRHRDLYSGAAVKFPTWLRLCDLDSATSPDQTGYLLLLLALFTPSLLKHTVNGCGTIRNDNLLMPTSTSWPTISCCKNAWAGQIESCRQAFPQCTRYFKPPRYQVGVCENLSR